MLHVESASHEAELSLQLCGSDVCCRQHKIACHMSRQSTLFRLPILSYHLRESQLLPPFTRAWLNFFTLTFRALGRSVPLQILQSEVCNAMVLWRHMHRWLDI